MIWNCYMFFHLVITPPRVHFHRWHHSPHADDNAVHRSTNGQLWPQLLQRLYCAVLRWWYDVCTRPPSPWCLSGLNECCLASGEVFVVQWERVRLSGKESNGAFTFQAALHKTGTITFGYREVRLCPPFASSSLLQKPVIPLFAHISDAFIAGCD